MTMDRRTVLILGGSAAASVLVGRASAADLVEVAMTGTANGSRVWFDPVGLLVAPGTTLRWTNGDRGNAHTATSFEGRIPQGAEPWDSDFLLPGESFETALSVPGVYDYFCIPHLHAGMVGRILVGDTSSVFVDYPAEALDEPVRNGLPAIVDILTTGRVEVSP